jgi:hypothetical protein
VNQELIALDHGVNLTRPEVEPLASLSDPLLRRLSKWIVRVFRGAYGARTTLREVVRAAALQMLAAGTSPSDVLRALERYVLDHPECLARDRRNLVTGQPLSRMLIELTRQVVAAVAPSGEASESGERRGMSRPLLVALAH